MKDSERQRRHFNKIAEQYITSRSGAKQRAYKDVYWKYIFDQFQKHMGQVDQLHGLDAMCGNAEFAERFVTRFPSIKMSAFDYSDGMVESARKIVGNKIDVFQCDILKLDQTEVYDFIVLVGGLHHVPHHADIAVKNLYKALKRGGLFLSFEPTHNNFLWKWIRESIYKKNDIFEESTEQGFVLKEYNELLTRNNFDVIFQTYPGLLGYILYYNPDAFPFLNKGPVQFARFLCKSDLLLGKTLFGKFFSFTSATFAAKR